MTATVKDIEKGGAKLYTPEIDIIERETEFAIFADVPGVDEGHVDVTLEGDTLTVYGTVASRQKTPAYLYSEFDPADYKRVFTLARGLDTSKIKASVKNGVVEILIPKAEEVKPRKIAIV